MRYFHRTSLPIPEALTAADAFFAGRLTREGTDAARRVFRGAMGSVTLTVTAEGGHYTRVLVETDQVGESEVDKLAKRFLATLHARQHQAHEVRGAY
jgi:hypothetical protein